MVLGLGDGVGGGEGGGVGDGGGWELQQSDQYARSEDNTMLR